MIHKNNILEHSAAKLPMDGKMFIYDLTAVFWVKESNDEHYAWNM